jgi:hypothetical protein
MLNNRELRATLEELGVAQADLVDAGLLANPTISGDLVNSTRGNGLGGGLALSQSLLSVFLIPAKRRIAKTRLSQVGGARRPVGPRARQGRAGRVRAGAGRRADRSTSTARARRPPRSPPSWPSVRSRPATSTRSTSSCSRRPWTTPASSWRTRSSPRPSPARS